MDEKTLIVERRGPVDWVTLNRPAALNALNGEMIDELATYFHDLLTRPSTRVVVLRGAGRAFCAGMDLSANDLINGLGAEQGKIAYDLSLQRRISEIVMRMRRAPQPIVSLVHGAACGGGFALALASDIRIAGASARMNAAFVKLGLSGCDIGVSYFLPRLVGTSLASELLMTGRFIGAERALRTGLVSDVVEDDRLEEAADTLLQDLLRTSPLGLRLTKECLAMNIDAPSLQSAIAMEDRNQILCAQTNDVQEAIAAFHEKRPPIFEDR